MGDENYSLRCRKTLSRLKEMGNSENVRAMERFGISPTKPLGIPVIALRTIAREIGKDHLLPIELWGSGFHEARILASMVDVPSEVTPAQMDSWAYSFDSWDLCDHCCGNLFDKTPYAIEKAAEWSVFDEEFVKRAGYVLMAELAVHDKQRSDQDFVNFLPFIEKGATDERNYVKKAVNWSLRQIGKRNVRLNRLAIETAERIEKLDLKCSRWIARDALRELKGKFGK